MSDQAPQKKRITGIFAFVGAFVGFYPADATALAEFDPVTRFLYAARSVILVISAQAAMIAGLLALADRKLDPVLFLLVLVGFVVLHAISNLSNDYFGYRRGHDTEDSPRRRYTLHPVASGLFTMRFLAVGLIVLAVIALAIAAYFTFLRGWPALVLCLIGILLLYSYDAAPTALKELGLGELASFLVWGPLMIGGGYFVITGIFAFGPFFISIPYGLGVASILIGKHIDQRSFDASQHQRTLPVLMGEGRARVLNIAVVAGMYVVTVAAVVWGLLTPLALVVVVAGPRALRAVRVMAQPAPAAAPEGYVGWPLWYHRVCLVHNRQFGWLFIAGLLAGSFFPGLMIKW
jgi:1,4-dihydroxy-2-naphthoate octaprenyltransferase